MQFVKHLWAMIAALNLTACGTIDLSQVISNLPQRAAPSTPSISQPTPAVTASTVSAESRARDMETYRRWSGAKITQANESMTFSGKLPDPLASIPVIEITLNADGSIRNLDVRRAPRFYPETAQIAMAAIRRAAPFGSIAHLPQPWVFNETFLFNDALKFQLLSLQP